MAKNSVYTQVFDIYGFNTVEWGQRDKDKLLKEKLRRIIGKELKEAYPDRDWADLTPGEKDVFLYITIRDSINKYVMDNMKSQVRKKIDSYIADKLLLDPVPVDDYNKTQDDVMKQFYPTSGTHDDIKKAYEGFLAAYEKSGLKAIPPTFKEWVANPLRIHDYQMSELSAINESLYTHNYNDLPSREDINNTILSCVLKLLKDKWRYDLDTEEIYHCLYVIKRFESKHDDSSLEHLVNTIDTTSDIPLEEQEKIIAENREYINCKNKIDSLDFFKYTAD